MVTKIVQRAQGRGQWLCKDEASCVRYWVTETGDCLEIEFATNYPGGSRYKRESVESFGGWMRGGMFRESKQSHICRHNYSKMTLP